MWKVTAYGVRSGNPYSYRIPGTMAANPHRVFLAAWERHGNLLARGVVDEPMDARPGRRSVEWLKHEHDPVAQLTVEDMSVLRLVAVGATTTELQRSVCLSESSVKARIRRLRFLFGARDKAHLVAQVYRSGIDLLEETTREGDELT